MISSSLWRSFPAGWSGRAVPLAFALIAGSVGGYIFWLLETPLPWMLGAMTVCMVLSLAGLRAKMPTAARRPTVTIIGVMLGAAFHPGILDQIATWWISVAGLALTVAIGTGLCIVYYRYVLKFDPVTAYFSSVPGGLVEMIALGGERGGDPQRIALAHACRVFIVVFSVPFIVSLMNGGVSVTGSTITQTGDTGVHLTDYTWVIGCAVVGGVLGKVLKLPSYALLGPMVVAGGLHLSGFTQFNSPPELIAIAQIILGTGVGLGFSGRGAGEVLKTLALSVVSTGMFIAVTFVAAISISRLAGIDPVLLMLAYAPAGVAEMGIIALGLGVEAAFVAVHHVARLSMIVAFAPPVQRLLGKT